MNCEQALELMSARLDGELSRQEEQQVKDHLKTCPECRQVWEQLCALQASLDELEPMQAPDNFAQGVMSRIREMEQAKQPKVVPLFRRPEVKALAGLAACAALCMGLFRGGVGMNASKAAPEAAAPAAEADVAVEAAPAEALEHYMAMTAVESAPESMAPEAPGASAPAEPRMEEADVEREAVPEARCSDCDLVEDTLYVYDALPDGAQELLAGAAWEECEADGTMSCLISAGQAMQLIQQLEEQGIAWELVELDESARDAIRLVLCRE